MRYCLDVAQNDVIERLNCVCNLATLLRHGIVIRMSVRAQTKLLHIQDS